MEVDCLQGGFSAWRGHLMFARSCARWTRKDGSGFLIEFEYESRNFLVHQHRVEDCDMIVCWTHNWEGCPLEVVELRTLEWNQLMGEQYFLRR